MTMPCTRVLRLLSLIGVCCLAANVTAQQLPGRVVRVVDGDTLVLDVRDGQHVIDLAGIDAPEPGQPWGGNASEYLYRTLGGAFIVVDLTGNGTSGNPSGTIHFKGRDIALDMLYGGLAWSTIGVDEQNGDAPTTDTTHPYAVAEADARAARRGLWSDPEPVPPWQWRRPRQYPEPTAKRERLPR